MINLLPPQQKKDLLEEQKYKLFLISVVLTVVFLIALSLALLAVRINISAKSQGEKLIITEQIQNRERDILATNKDLQDLASFYEKKPDFIKIIEKISNTVPQNIRLTSFSVNYSKKTDAFALSLQGFSAAREDLSQFKKNLESESYFKDVNFPSSNWIKPKDIEFSISFKASN